MSSNDQGPNRLWYRRVGPDFWVAFKGDNAVAEGDSKDELRDRLQDAGYEWYKFEHIQLRLITA